jgi:uncharacterized membrane protein
MKRWQSVLLIVSLVLNIFLVGTIAGGLWRWTHHAGQGARVGWRVNAAAALPRDQARTFRRAVRATVHANAGAVAEGRAARAEAARLFVQPQFDSAAVLAQLARARVADGIVRGQLETTVVTFAATLPPDQRQALAQALRTGPLREGPKRPKQ